MGKAIMGCAAVSADGYIADDDGQIGSLFDWMSGGDVEWKCAMETGDEVTLGNPSRVAQGNRVTHLLYDVER
jgi:hypothetical protein